MGTRWEEIGCGAGGIGAKRGNDFEFPAQGRALTKLALR